MILWFCDSVACHKIARRPTFNLGTFTKLWIFTFSSSQWNYNFLCSKFFVACRKIVYNFDSSSLARGLGGYVAQRYFSARDHLPSSILCATHSVSQIPPSLTDGVVWRMFELDLSEKRTGQWELSVDLEKGFVARRIGASPRFRASGCKQKTRLFNKFTNCDAIDTW